MTAAPPQVRPVLHPTASTGHQAVPKTPAAGLRPPGPPPAAAGPCAPAATLASVLVLCLGAFMVARPPWWSFNYAAILAVVVIGLSGRLPRPRTADIFALLTGAWAYASLLWTDSTDLTLPSAYRYASVCLLFVAARHVVRGRRDLLLVGWSYLAGCAVVAIEVVTGARSQGPVVLFDHRYGIDGINLNFTAYTLAAGVVLALVVAAAAGAGRPLLRLSPLAAAVLLGYAVLLTGCRGAAIGMVVGVVAALAARFLPRLTGWTVAVLAAALVALLPFGFLSAGEVAWLDGLYARPTGDFSGRLSIWPYAVTTWSEAPLTGSGAGVFMGSSPFEIGPHNLLLTVGNDLGLVGVLLYFGTIAVALAAAARTGRAGQLLTAAFTATMVPIWLTGQWETSLAFWLVLALVTVLPQVGGPAGGGAAKGRNAVRSQVPAIAAAGHAGNSRQARVHRGPPGPVTGPIRVH